MSIQNHNFPVEMQSIKTWSNIHIPTQLGNAVVRTDTNQVLGIHGRRYELISHDDVFNAVHDAVKQADITKDYETNIDLTDNGARMKGEILFNDLVIEPVKNDFVQFRIQFYNSYDGRWSVQIACDALRLWCENGCTTPDAVFRTWQKHTFALNVSAYTNQIQKGLTTFWNQRDRWKKLSDTPCDITDVSWLFEKTLCASNKKQRIVRPDDPVSFNKKQHEILGGIYEMYSSQLGHNMWAAYNTATHWATHTDQFANPLDKTRERENLVAKMQRSDEWALLVD